MAYVSGAVLLVIAAVYGLLAMRHIRSVRAEEAQLRAAGAPVVAPERHPSLTIMADVMPGITVFMVACLGGFVTLTFFAAGATRYLSVFDLLAFLVLLAAYCFWLVTKTKVRVGALPSTT